ncbi:MULTISPECIES: NUDIX hydrolase [Methylobacterium]|uniref:NUDIX hydrolase n=1 Tax=Methylobacterium TaxID=407 RepID=UPI0013EB1BB9|nr:NUDIX domain-containing protein [Methylobacterium sp. DB0501]NGM34498.1 NUDIX domain-containing protein [Methylobacterium sp. DB0501]
MRKIVKVGLALLRDQEILLVRKKGSFYFILPGGKPELGETDVVALSREIEEELGCTLDESTLRLIGSFSDVAAGLVDTEVTVQLYTGKLIGTPKAQAEIEDLVWFTLENSDEPNLAPSLRNSILPFLSRNNQIYAR